jgi:hypothetical protein
MSVIQTDSLSIGNLSQLSKDGSIYGVVHSGTSWYCTDADCSNSKLIAKCDPGTGTSKNERCACLSKSAKCPAMLTNSGNVNGTIYDIQFSPFNIDTSSNCPSSSPDPNWSWALRDSTKTPIVTCQYPADAIPTDDQAEILVQNVGNKDNRKLLANYCFSPEQQTLKCPPPLTSCPKAISRSDICNKFGQADKNLYDQRAFAYCLNLYNQNKGKPDFDISKTGCKCIKDQKIDPDPGLTAILTVPGLAGGAHCVWGPCVPSSPNLNTYSDRDRSCPAVSCLNLINVGGQASIDKSQFIQNLNCTGSKCNCNPGEVCNETTGTCSSKRCTGDQDCIAGQQVCRMSDGVCVPIPGGRCTKDSDCPSGYCDPGDKICKPKPSPSPPGPGPSPPGPGPSPPGPAPAPIPCKKDADCTSGSCDLTKGICNPEDNTWLWILLTVVAVVVLIGLCCLSYLWTRE